MWVKKDIWLLHPFTKGRLHVHIQFVYVVPPQKHKPIIQSCLTLCGICTNEKYLDITFLNFFTQEDEIQKCYKNIMLNIVHYLPQTRTRVKTNILIITDAQIWEKSKRHHKMLGAWSVTWSKFHTQNSHELGATIQNSVISATWHTGFVHPCL